jgi:hypothetical protein
LKQDWLLLTVRAAKFLANRRSSTRADATGSAGFPVERT